MSLFAMSVLVVVYIAFAPLVGYILDQRDIHRNSNLIERVARDETATKKLATAQAQSLCLSGNDYRMQDAELWHFIFNAFPNPAPTPEEKRRTAQFLAFLAQHDKQRDCSKL